MTLSASLVATNLKEELPESHRVEAGVHVEHSGHGFLKQGVGKEAVRQQQQREMGVSSG